VSKKRQLQFSNVMMGLGIPGALNSFFVAASTASTHRGV
jgi:hypothetical protein